MQYLMKSINLDTISTFSIYRADEDVNNIISASHDVGYPASEKVQVI